MSAPRTPIHLRRTLTGLALAAAGAASANTLDFDFNLTPNGLERTNWTHAVDLAKFNPALGTLTRVDVTLDWAGRLDGAATNLSAETNPVSIRHDLAYRLESRSGTVLASQKVFGTTFATTLGVNATQGYGPLSSSGAYAYSLSASDPRSATFVGSGLVDLRVSARGITSQDANGPIDLDVNTFASARGRLSYTYAPVPEPASMTALGLGVLGLLRRRKVGGAH